MLANRTIQAASSGTIYQILRSLRFRSAASAYLQRTFGSPTNNTRWTWSCWVKRGRVGVAGRIFGVGTDASGVNQTALTFGSGDDLDFFIGDGAGSTLASLRTTQVFRDPSAWYHIVFIYDSANATANNRQRMFVNGVEVTAFSLRTNPGSSQSSQWNQNGTTSRIGVLPTSPSNYFDGYMTEVSFIDGQALDASSFGQIDPNTGAWSAKKYTGAYGNNGFYLDFSDNSSLTTASNVGLGKDVSGNANYWVTNNISIATANVVQSFTTTGTTSWTAPVGITSVEYLVVGGGGGGYWGGGGAGGFRTGTLSVTPGNSYTVTVGAGGASQGLNGSDSVFSTITSLGGGGGPNAAGNGAVGGSGGGGGSSNGLGGAGTAGQGFAGGRGFTDGSTYTSGGGGGGSSQAGSNGGNPGAGGKGGDGTISSISGSAVTYAGGGGGYGDTYGPGANGAGGGSTPNRGGGGSSSGVAGGSGIVILSYSGTASTSTYDSMLDVPLGGGGSERGNYCTLNPLRNGLTLSNANLSFSAAINQLATGTIGMVSGKWYWEVVPNIANLMIGLVDSFALTNNQLASVTTGWCYYGVNGFKYSSGSGAAYGATFTSGDVIGVALDADSGTLTFYKNGSTQAVAYSGLNTGPYFSAVSSDQSGNTCSGVINFGQRPFAYTPPTGFKALHTGNLPQAIIKKPNQYFDTTLYTGDGASTKTISGINFQSDFIWIKTRSASTNHQLQDSVRGFNLALASSTTQVEGDNGTLGVKNVTPTSFDVGAGSAYNANTTTYVAWLWKAGGAAVTNNTGSISAQVSANPTAGFSIVSYTGNGTVGATVGHGLGVAPKLVIVKGRMLTDWTIFHSSLSSLSNVLNLNSTGAESSQPGSFNSTAPGSSVFTLGAYTYLNINGGAFMAYCFSEITGYSKISSYAGNGSSDGPFIYCGFRPKYIMIKNISTAYDWYVYDTARGTYNVYNSELYPNDPAAEVAGGGGRPIDILSSGFKIRNSNQGHNSSGNNYIFIAFAEVPFKYALAR